ncbi:D-alanyl-D-alanine carboxypeptidase [Phenylobacterium immobile]|uniref:D-alanyl-D-alanine carboxypeptidase n=1 Tax=Phenylobacterium immobile TaxID=21 RepID=UPI000A68B488|nr:D-alanyl-D-alanine carboxypeptidase [Phenylobacterium immobile]
MLQPARRLMVSIGLAATMALSPLAGTAQAQTPGFRNILAATQTKYAAIVVDAKTGEVLYAKHADDPRYPASITKIMTLYLTFEALSSGKLKTTDRVVFSPRAAAASPSKLGVRPGESISVSEAMQALAIKSANDAAVAMAEKIGGSEARFAAMMTLRAQELGMQNTHFANPHGLPDSRQLTTARDIAILSRAVMRDYPQYYHLFNQRSFTFRGQTMTNHNRLLGRMPGVDGLKTGFTNASGFNLAVSAVRDNRRLIGVVMGGPTTAQRDQNAEDLLLTGFDVMSRRARGEQITVAQSLFEPEPTGPIQRTGIEQGDAEQDGVKIVLAHAPIPAPVAARAAARPARGEDWAVQVGAFKKQSDARAQIALVKQRFSKWVSGGAADTDRAGGVYKARIQNLSEGDARGACKAIKAKKMACMVVKG